LTRFNFVSDHRITINDLIRYL